MSRRNTGSKRDLREIRSFLKVLKWTKPVWRVLGVQIHELDELIASTDHFLQFSAQFNDTFADRGWISYGWQNSSNAQAAFRAASAGDMAEAEDILVQAYSPEEVSFVLRQMTNLKCFSKRTELAKLAADDYANARYHASIPVVLALLDGMGQELTGAGFLRQGARFVDDDSFVEIGPGLSRLIRTLTASRGGTSTSPLTIPYRHGILHGVDLNYANKMVAAKSWAALFAAGWYASQTENPQPLSPAQPSTFREFWTGISYTRKQTRELEALGASWKPRTRLEQQEALAALTPGTPEDVVHRFLQHWQAKNFGRMAELVREHKQQPQGSLAGRIRKKLPVPPSSFVILSSDDSAPAAGWVEASIHWGEFTEQVRLRMLHFDGDRTLPSNAGRGSWYIYSLWPLEAAHLAASTSNQRER